ncbi:ABC transporter substrate-binding protein [Coraliomargarita parva]|uniref:ABC transporter substrate-binding protein n=1 Tax=Coraliomargarita parva TaxID=3014050 RepID=UPI0022B2E51B|nr:extracellular solute-binding protein [Coraliomargarita parva]
MKKSTLRFNPNWIAVGLLLGAFIFSAVRFYVVSKGRSTDSETNTELKIVRITHWQLEPGFREAMQWAIDEYNALPQVREAGVRIEQKAIPSRVFNQFMNVHLISGTAPDIAVNGGSKISAGNALAKFYAPLGNYVNDPNPYNAPEYQKKDLTDSDAAQLEEASWMNTFADGMETGYDTRLGEYYSIPLSTWGGLRIFYNLKLLNEVKDFTRNQFKLSPQPEWLSALWRTAENSNGFLPEAKGAQWLESDNIPQTMGELMLYCYAVKAYAQDINAPFLVPVAGSSYPGNDIAELYRAEFLSSFWKEISFAPGVTMNIMEVLSGYTRGIWSFTSPEFKSYFEFTHIIGDFYPSGFMGLDRESANRRFVQGKAAIITSGGWDAAGIFLGVSQRSKPEDRFEIAIAPEPLPVKGERWADVLSERVTEAGSSVTLKFAINKQSQNFDWALDFMKFLTSQRINESFNQRAQWLPVIIDTTPPASVAAFLPIFDGLPRAFTLDLDNSSIPSNIRSLWRVQTKLYMTGDISYEELVSRMDSFLRNPVLGIHKNWITTMQTEKEKSRSNSQAATIERFNTMLGSEISAKREKALLYGDAVQDEGIQLQLWWHEMHPDEPYPSY